jgi:hypothetical protein
MFLFLGRWKEFKGTLVKGPLNDYISRAAYRVYKWWK